jgi:hypothetical protein
MKLFSLFASALAIPQRLLAPGLRDKDASGAPKRFVTDDGYGLETSYDWSANKNPNAKPRGQFQTAMMLNFICRGTPTDDLCRHPLSGIWGPVDSLTAKMYNMGKVAGDVMTEAATDDDNLLANFGKLTSDEMKAVWYNKMLKQKLNPGTIDWRPVQNGSSHKKHNPALESLPWTKRMMYSNLFPGNSSSGSNQNQPIRRTNQSGFRNMHVGHHQMRPIMTHMMWNKICLDKSNVICTSRNLIKQQYTDYVSNVKNAYSKILN